MSKELLAWSLLSVYGVVTAVLAYRGYKRTHSMEGFAVGNRDMSPVLVGLSLAVQLTSVATFIVNPGLVYAFGLPAFLGMGVAAALGIVIGVVVLSKGFRRTGQQMSVLTLPGWFGKRYGSRALQVGFALLSLALITFVVLILVAMAYVLMKMLGIPAWTALLGIIVFVFGYVLLGGVNTSVYTNSIQALIMVVVALILVISGLPLLFGGSESFLDRLAARDANLVGLTNAASPYFRNLFEVFVCNFIVGLAIVCQPHVVTKALCLKSERDTNRYLLTAIGVGVVFMLVMLTGLYARLTLAGNLRIDLVIPTYIDTQFSPMLSVVIGIGVLCAGVSTLEGLLLALSAILASDLFLPVLRRRMSNSSDAAVGKVALMAARLSLMALGGVAFGLAIYQMKNPTGGSVAIFAQYGIYCLFSASFAPVVFGLFARSVGPRLAIASALSAVLVYVGVARGELLPMYNNPAVLSTFAILTSTLVMGAGVIYQRCTLDRRSEGARDSAGPPRGTSKARLSRSNIS